MTPEEKVLVDAAAACEAAGLRNPSVVMRSLNVTYAAAEMIVRILEARERRE